MPCSGELRVQRLHEHCLDIADCYWGSAGLFSQKSRCSQTVKSADRLKNTQTVLYIVIAGNDNTHRSISSENTTKPNHTPVGSKPIQMTQKLKDLHNCSRKTSVLDARPKTQVLKQNHRRAGDCAEGRLSLIHI